MKFKPSWASCRQLKQKKSFGIRSTRLYKIWRKPAAPLLAPPAQNLLPNGDGAVASAVSPEQQQQAPRPIVEDFYKRLEGLKSQAEQSKRLLAEVLAQLALLQDNTQDAFIDELEEVGKAVSQRADMLEVAHHEQTEARLDLQKCCEVTGQMVEMAQKRTAISLAVIFV